MTDYKNNIFLFFQKKQNKTKAVIDKKASHSYQPREDSICYSCDPESVFIVSCPQK